jgi:hypothetical protein
MQDVAEGTGFFVVGVACRAGYLELKARAAGRRRHSWPHGRPMIVVM